MSLKPLFGESWSDPLLLVFFLNDFWLKIRDIVFPGRGTREPPSKRLCFLSRSFDSFLTSSTKCLLNVGYLDTDLVNPWSLTITKRKDYLRIRSKKARCFLKNFIYLRAKASSSAFLSSVRGGDSDSTMELLRLSESPNSNTNFPRYSSSSSDKFAASIWSLRIKNGFRNQSKNASFGRFFVVISVWPSPTQKPKTKQLINPKMLKETVLFVSWWCSNRY